MSNHLLQCCAALLQPYDRQVLLSFKLYENLNGMLECLIDKDLPQYKENKHEWINPNLHKLTVSLVSIHVTTMTRYIATVSSLFKPNHLLPNRCTEIFHFHQRKEHWYVYIKILGRVHYHMTEI